MEILDLLHLRRSIRKFSGEEVPRDKVEKILDAGLAAPSAMNEQKLRFTVLRRKEDIAAFQDAIGQALEKDNYKGFYACDTLIILTAPEEVGNAYFDTGCAMENMHLAAASLGVGACWINQLKTTAKHPAVRKLLDQYQVPQDHVGMAMLALGMPEQEILFERENKQSVHWVD